MLAALLLAVAAVMVACSPVGQGRASRMPRAPIFDRTAEGDTATTGSRVASDKASSLSMPASSPELPPADRIIADLAAAGVRENSAGALGNAALVDTLAAPTAIRDSTGDAPLPANGESSTGESLVGESSTGESPTGAPAAGEPSLLDIAENPDVDVLTGGIEILADTARTAGAVSALGGGTGSAPKPFLEHPVFGKSADSTVYDVRKNLVFVFGDGDLSYEDKQLLAPYMIIDAGTKEIFGAGKPDTAGVMIQAEFTQASAAPYLMDTITYNLETGKGKMKNLSTKDGEGWLMGRDFKKMDDNTVNLAHGIYTSCDRIEHPHYYIALTKAKVIPNNKIITGPAYFVMEDVPIYFLGIPGGFFPISTGPRSGLIFPKYGEETQRGFFLRDGGYYFKLGDYADLKLTGSIYSLGSWGVNASSQYVKRYKFNGRLNADYQRTVYGERNSQDYQNRGEFKLNWQHSQDPKANPRQTFSASVNFATAGYTKNATTTLQDHLNTQTNSSISYSRNWTAGSIPMNLTLSFSHSSNAKSGTIEFTLPSVSFTVSQFSPFKRKMVTGKQRWYEKITMRYSLSAKNSTGTIKESEVFSANTLRNMTNGVLHSIPVSASFMFFDYITFTPSFNYSESWNFKRQRRVWDPTLGEHGDDVLLDPEFGFFRKYNWNVGGSLTTKWYGRFQVKRREGKDGWLQEFRHVVTPSVGFSYAPDFQHPRYGFMEFVQTGENGQYTGYSPVLGSPTVSPGGPSASVNFSLANQLEFKVRDRNDTTGTGVKKIPIIEQLSFSGSYDFLRDSMNLSNINISLRSGQIFKNFAINLNATWDPYDVVDVGGRPVRVSKFRIGKGKFGHITNTSWSFGYSWEPTGSSQPAMNDINSGSFVAAYSNPYDHSINLDPALRRQYMTSTYYDFNIPWSFGFNYSVSYTNDGLRSRITQTLGFQGSVNLTENLGFNFSGGFDIARGQFTPMQIVLNRKLHCWNMSFQWIPIGQLKSYQFHIGILSPMLADIKYDKSSSRYDNLME